MNKRSKQDRAKYSLLPPRLSEKYTATIVDRRDIFVNDRTTIEALWYGGCFGKGTQSRSQPFNTTKSLKEIEISLSAVNLDVDLPTERLKLSRYEAVFLVLLGLLRIVSENGDEVALEKLWTDALMDYLRYDLEEKELEGVRDFLAGGAKIAPVTRDKMLLNSFMLNYVTFHYYRTEGWVVRSGILYGVNWMLYREGPVFSHAIHGVHTSHSIEICGSKYVEDVRWNEVLSDIRLHHQVKKGWVISRVDGKFDGLSDDELCRIYRDPVDALKRFTVHDRILKRWVPSRTRE